MRKAPGWRGMPRIGHSPGMVEILTSLPDAFKRAIAAYQSGKLVEAESACRSILQAEPSSFDALHMLGLIAARQGRFDEADRLIGHALKINPRFAAGHLNRGNAQAALKRYQDALDSYGRALAAKPDYAEAHYNRGSMLSELARLDEALAAFDRALALKPAYAEALIKRGRVLQALKRTQEAVASYDLALAAKPDDAEAAYSRGNALWELRRLDEAVASYDRALKSKPDHADALNNRGVVLRALKRPDEAVASYDRALKVRPDFAEALGNRGLALADLNRHDRAAEDLARVLAINPAHEFARGAMLHSRMYCCDWRDFDRELARLEAEVRAGKPVSHPFPFLGLSGAADAQLECARAWVGRKCPAAPQPLWKGEVYSHDRIRLAYLSADFHDHATSFLAAGLFERHDRARFKTVAVSFGSDASGPMRARLEGAFHRFVDVRGKTDREAAAMLREMEIDIAVDLKGFTKDCRPDIFAFRPAPVQVNYLGFPATMGAEYIDYIIADRIVIPPEHESFYSEKTALLPGSYQVNDSSRRIGARMPTRRESGLPDDGFVFCSFNSNYKITPAMFDLWMRLLAGVPGSVLWLFVGNDAAIANLKREAASRGVDPGRLVFAGRVTPEEHLARHRLADLFLDTLPCNAHTTASDALWAGLPVVTCVGTSFAGRVAASLLNAAGLPELAAESLLEYEALALRLAADTVALAALKAKLSHNRATCALFDTGRYARHIEKAYETMWQRQRRGEKPTGFAVEPLN